MNSPDNPSMPTNDETALSPEERKLLAGVLEQVQRKDVIRRRNSVLADLDAASFVAVTLPDPDGPANPLRVCSENRGAEIPVLVSLPACGHQLQKFSGTLVCTSGADGSAVVPSAGPDEPADEFDMPSEMTFELQVAGLPENVRLAAGEVHPLPVGELAESTTEATWSALRKKLPQPIADESGKLEARTRDHTLRADSGDHGKPLLTVGDSEQGAAVFLQHDGYMQATFVRKFDSPVIAEVSYDVAEGSGCYYYFLDARAARRSGSGPVQTRPRRFEVPPDPISATVRLRIRPLSAAHLPLLTQDQRRRWLPDPPLAALTVRRLTENRYRFTIFDVDLDDIAASPNSALVVRMMNPEGGVA